VTSRGGRGDWGRFVHSLTLSLPPSVCSQCAPFPPRLLSPRPLSDHWTAWSLLLLSVGFVASIGRSVA
jgi:hypothetical protein